MAANILQLGDVAISHIVFALDGRVMRQVVIAGHLIAVAGFMHWWGGSCYGPRFTTGLVPWFALLGILGVDAMRRETGANVINRLSRTPLAANVSLLIGGALLLLSVWINGRGAVSAATARWNSVPENIDKTPERLWDWREPQFLAGLLRPPLPQDVPVLETPARIVFASREADKFLWYGWSAAEAEFRWTEGTEATFVFSLKQVDDIVLRINCAPFLFKDKLKAQRISVELNGDRVGELRLTDDAANVYPITLPKRALHTSKNILLFKLPDAAKPKDLTESNDARLLGISVQWIEIVSLTSTQ